MNEAAATQPEGERTELDVAAREDGSETINEAAATQPEGEATELDAAAGADGVRR